MHRCSSSLRTKTTQRINYRADDDAVVAVWLPTANGTFCEECNFPVDILREIVLPSPVACGGFAVCIISSRMQRMFYTWNALASAGEATSIFSAYQNDLFCRRL